MTKGKIGTILALDPAGPGFESVMSVNRLRKDDADYVECVHSNGEALGLFEPFCNVDFYPNFGLRQPGKFEKFKFLTFNSTFNPKVATFSSEIYVVTVEPGSFLLKVSETISQPINVNQFRKFATKSLAMEVKLLWAATTLNQRKT